jgi:hypothetical protein
MIRPIKKSKLLATRAKIKPRSTPHILSKAKRPQLKSPHSYSLFAVAIVLLSCIFWAYLSAKLHGGNSDQLVNSYLFESLATFHNAALPSAHSFLLKWPFFLLIKH